MEQFSNQHSAESLTDLRATTKRLNEFDLLLCPRMGEGGHVDLPLSAHE